MWKQPECPLTNEWIKIWCVYTQTHTHTDTDTDTHTHTHTHTLEYYSAIKKNAWA